MVKVHIKNTKHITIANIYIPPRDTTSTHYKTADKHHTDGRQAEHTKGQDAQQLQALARRHSMQNHSKK